MWHSRSPGPPTKIDVIAGEPAHRRRENAAFKFDDLTGKDAVTKDRVTAKLRRSPSTDDQDLGRGTELLYPLEGRSLSFEGANGCADNWLQLISPQEYARRG